MTFMVAYTLGEVYSCFVRFQQHTGWFNVYLFVLVINLNFFLIYLFVKLKKRKKIKKGLSDIPLYNSEKYTRAGKAGSLDAIWSANIM